MSRITNDAAALDETRRCRGLYRVAIIDLEREEANRLALARRLKALDADIKVLLIADSTGSWPNGRDDRAFVEAIIARPIQDETLITALERALV